MFRWMRPLLLLGLFLVASSPGSAQDKMPSTPYFPLAKGTTWQYKLRDGSKFTMKVVDHDKVGSVPCAKIELITEGGKKEPDTELISVKADGVFRYSFRNAVADKPVQILKLPPKAGETWKIDSKALGDSLQGTYKVGKEEDITVPAGTYKAFPVVTDDLDVAGIKVAETRYYAKDVGMIKQEIKIGGQTTIAELVKFEPGGK